MSQIFLQNKIGDSPLHVAASHGHLNVVNLLLEAGSNPKLKNNAGSTAEDLANDPIVKNAIQRSQQSYSSSNLHDYNEEDYNDESD